LIGSAVFARLTVATKHADSQTDRERDRQTDRHTDYTISIRHALESSVVK